MSIAARRLQNQLVSRHRFAKPVEVVRWFGAMQAQDYLGALWALGQRTPNADESSIEATLAEGSVLRTHVFRGTWQYVAPEDVRWMLALVGPRVIASMASRLRELDLDAKTLERSCELFEGALEGGNELTRTEMAAVLSRRRIGSGGRMLHLLGHAELRGVICSGARRGKQSTFALLRERAPKARVLERDEALAELAKRYFQSRGPATERDFSWWTGLSLRDVRKAIELAKPRLERESFGDEHHWFAREATRARRGSTAYLLPAFDECLVGYQDRSAFVDRAHVKKVNAGGGMLRPALVIEGRVIGTWQRRLEKRTVSIAVRPFRKLVASEEKSVRAAAERYAAFLGLPVHWA